MQIPSVVSLQRYYAEHYDRGQQDIGVKLECAGERDYVHVNACFSVPRRILVLRSNRTENSPKPGALLKMLEQGGTELIVLTK